jgi:hypothetical protein
MSHIFISYSRRDLDFAQTIVDALSESGLEAWIDWKSIPKGEDWEEEIYRGIEGADAFLFLVSPDSVKSPMCNKEVLHAIRNNKRILPILLKDTRTGEFLEEIARKEIERLNWIFCRKGQDDFSEAIEHIRKTIQTDYDWVRFHTDLQVKALAWDGAKRDVSMLLRGRQLKEIEEMIGRADSQIEPLLTEIQQQYVRKSRMVDRQRKTRPFKVLLALAITVFLGGKLYFLVLPVASACPQVGQVSVRLDATDLPEDIRESLEAAIAAGPPTTTRGKCKAGIEGEVRAIANYIPETGEIGLAIQLPGMPAYQMDFLQELRTFGPEHLHVEEATALLLAASAYSLGDYSTVEELLQEQTSLTAITLVAQAQLFTDNLDSSRESYKLALGEPQPDREFTGKLQMGAALAWWRPASYHYMSGEEKEAACNKAGEHYLQAKDWTSTNALARNITTIFALYCAVEGDENLGKYTAWLQEEPIYEDNLKMPEARQINAAAHYILAYRLGPDNKETRDEYKSHLLSARELLLARALLSEFQWEVEGKCAGAREMREEFREGIVSGVEKRKLRSLRQSQPLFCR